MLLRIPGAFTKLGKAVGFLKAANNLSDLTNAATARTNLGLATVASSGSAADLGTGTLPAARLPALTGDVTTAAGSAATTIANTVVTYAKMQNVSATSRFIGRITAGAGSPEELTGTQATTLLDAFTSTLKGLVPASGGGTTNFLRADGTWVAGGGGAATTEPFVTIGNSAGLSAERALTAGSGITLTDGGVNSTVTMAVGAGAVLQCLSTTYTANANLTVLIPFDDTIPTSTEGTQILSQAITPASASNKILCIVSNMWAQGQGSGGNGQSFAASLLRGTTTIDAGEAMLAVVDSGGITDNFINDIQMVFLDSPATTAATTYSVRVGADGGTIRLNGLSGARHFGGAATVTLTLMEIKG